MKYTDFYTYLNAQVIGKGHIGPSISIKIGEANSISISNKKIENSYRFIIFPIKIYGENIKHLNVLLLDQKTKIIERYEPFNQYLNFDQINNLIEPLLYKLMENQKIYFLKYQTALNTKNILNDKNCGIYCLQYIFETLRRLSFPMKKEAFF